MPPIVDTTFDLLATLLIVAAVAAVIYRVIVGHPRHGDRHAKPTDAASQREPDPLVVRGPFLDPVPALTRALSLEGDSTGGREAGGAGDDAPAADDPGPLVTVASYQDVERAHLARLQLEQQGVPVFVADAGVVGMAWLYSNAVHGVKVQVPQRHVERAFHVLAAAERTAAPVSEGGEGGQGDEEAGAPRCPGCGSAEVYRVAKGRGVFFLLLLVLSLALPVVVRRYQCDQCGATYPHRPAENASLRT